MVWLFTDGACSGNPGPGAWAWIFQDNERRLQASGYEVQTTNNRMELSAALYGLMALDTQAPLTIVSDSAYLVKGMESWVEKWQKNGWINTQKKPVENQDLWKSLLIESQRFPTLYWKWVKGHGTHQGNIDADNLAQVTLKAGQHSLKSLVEAVPNVSLEPTISKPPISGLWFGDEAGVQGMLTSFPLEFCTRILHFKERIPVFFTGSAWQISCLETLTRLIKSAPLWYTSEFRVIVAPCPEETEAYQAFGFYPKTENTSFPLWAKVLGAVLGIFGTLEVQALDSSSKMQCHAYLKAKRVYWRAGPGSEHAVLWSYTCPGWPVFIRKRWSYWCQVEDVKGAIGWVHGNLLTFRRVAFILYMKTPLRVEPSVSSAIKAYLQKGVLAFCLKQEGPWVYVRLLKEHYEGWVYDQHIWNAKRGGS
ncbi:ribonuclease HI [Holospora curviuscula]|uniref:ribonuclease H n=1 Tax=Holospora curviuscula TaxID=1082868 RepID=A0A2S5R8J8_9PROT|nr:ribonuclease HI [Holospora curviuscula]PPE03502.1 Ribonuclease H [Holospora curviuscula]